MNVNVLQVSAGMENYVFLVTQEKFLIKKQINVNVLQVYVGMDMDVQMFQPAQVESNGMFILIPANAL